MIAFRLLLDLLCLHLGYPSNTLENFGDTETLALADGTALRDDNLVPDTQILPCGVGQEFLADAIAFAVRRVHDGTMDGHRDGVGHLRRGDDSGLGAH